MVRPRRQLLTLCAAKRCRLDSLQPRDGEGAEQPRPWSQRAKHGQRGVVTPVERRVITITGSCLVGPAENLLFQVHQAAVQHGPSVRWNLAAASPLPTSGCFGCTSGLDRHRDGHHHGDGGLDRWGSVLSLEEKGDTEH